MKCVCRITWFVNGGDAVGNYVIPDLYLQLFRHTLHHGLVETLQTSSHPAGAVDCGQVSSVATEEESLSKIC